MVPLQRCFEIEDVPEEASDDLNVTNGSNSCGFLQLKRSTLEDLSEERENGG